MGTWKAWLHGLTAAVIGALSSGVTLVIADPQTFSFTKAGMLKVAQVAAVQGMIAAAAYLKQSPLPNSPPAGGGSGT